MAFTGSGLLMKVLHTNPERTFSAISTEMPRSIPRQSALYHFGKELELKASTNPYRPQAFAPQLDFKASKTSRHSLGKKASDPAAAQGTTVPSIGPCAGGPPHAVY